MSHPAAKGLSDSQREDQHCHKDPSAVLVAFQPALIALGGLPRVSKSSKARLDPRQKAV